jgi:hypothetical protein
MPVRIGRLEGDVERLIVIFDDVDVVGQESPMKLPDAVRRRDAEAEMEERGQVPTASTRCRARSKPSAVADDDCAVG